MPYDRLADTHAVFSLATNFERPKRFRMVRALLSSMVLREWTLWQNVVRFHANAKPLFVNQKWWSRFLFVLIPAAGRGGSITNFCFG